MKTVLSLFDGISGTQVALDRMSIDLIPKAYNINQ
jgi:hypothetical protein